MHQLGILLAAGYGRRFQAQQPQGNKLLTLLPNQQSVAATSLHHLRQAVEQVIVVIRPDSPQLREQLHHPNCLIVESTNAHTGMGASLADAAHTILQHYEPSSVNLLVTLADMPCIPLHCFQHVQQALHHHPIAAPQYQQQRGHPVGFQGHLLPELTTLCGDEGARSVIQRHGIHLLPCDDAGVCLDIDEPSDLTHPLLHSFLRSHP